MVGKNVQGTCPNCLNPDRRYFVHTDTGAGQCWQCGYKHGSKVSILSNFKKPESDEWLDEDCAFFKEAHVVPFRHKVPPRFSIGYIYENFRALYNAFYKNVAEQDMNMVRLAQYYACGFLLDHVDWRMRERFIMPVKANNRVLGYQARAVWPRVHPKYLNPGKGKSKPPMGIYPKQGGELLTFSKQPVIIVEGLKDAWRLSQFCPAICLLGKFMTEVQLEFLLQEVHTDAPLIVCLDEGTLFEVNTIVAQLRASGRKTIPLYYCQNTKGESLDDTSHRLYSSYLDFGSWVDQVTLQALVSRTKKWAQKI